MEASGQNYLGESRAQAAQSAAWLRRCNGALLGVVLVICGSSILMVVSATVINVAAIGRRGTSSENTALIALSIFLVLAFAKFCLASYRRGVDDLAERERWLREIETVAHRLGFEGTRSETRTEDGTVVRIHDLAMDDRPRGSLRHSLSLWRARVGETQRIDRELK